MLLGFLASSRSATLSRQMPCSPQQRSVEERGEEGKGKGRKGTDATLSAHLLLVSLFNHVTVITCDTLISLHKIITFIFLSFLSLLTPQNAGYLFFVTHIYSSSCCNIALLPLGLGLELTRRINFFPLK